VLFRKKIQDRSLSLRAITWRRFQRNMPAMIGLILIFIACIVSILGYLITSDKTPYANDQKPELHIKSPGFEADLLLVKRNEVYRESNFFENMLFGKSEEHASFVYSSFEFKGPDIILEEYTGNIPNEGSFLGFNLADVVYALNTKYPLKYDSLKNEIKFYRINEETPTVKSVAELRDIVIWRKKNTC
jgi:hypothetical protein